MKIDFDPKDDMSWLDYNVTSHLNATYSEYSARVQSLFTITKIVKNWPSLLLFRLGITKHLIMRFSDGNSVSVDSPRAYERFWRTPLGQRESHALDAGLLRTSPKDYFEAWREPRDNGKLDDIYSYILFMKRLYGWLEVKGRVVVDVGANVGDTAICFALSGAKHVYAFEPYPYSYEIAKRNVGTFRLNDRVTLLNEAVSGESGVINIPSRFKNTVGSDIRNFSSGRRVRITTLDDIVRRFRITGGSLKVDCEGSEYSLLLNASDDALRSFDQLLIEYHYGYRRLCKRLGGAGFRVWHDSPLHYRNSDAENPETYFGNIYAERRR